MEATFIQTCKRLPFLNRLYVLTVCSILCLSTLGLLYNMTYLTILYLLHATGMRFGLLAVKGAVQVASQARGKKTAYQGVAGCCSHLPSIVQWPKIKICWFFPLAVHSASSPPAFTLQSTTWKIKVWTSALTCPAQLLAFASV